MCDPNFVDNDGVADPMVLARAYVVQVFIKFLIKMPIARESKELSIFIVKVLDVHGTLALLTHLPGVSRRKSDQ